MAEHALLAGSLAYHYRRVRSQSLALCEPLAIEDYGIQPIEDASPPKWHLAHTTWFFETFLLQPYVADYRCFDSAFAYLFNSYYNGVGAQFPRALRGTLSRPTVATVENYRAYVDEAMETLLDAADAGRDPHAEAIAERVILGLNHEQQHQELLVTDLKVNLGHNPLRPAYRDVDGDPSVAAAPLVFHPQAGGLVEIGCDVAGGDDLPSFAFDNEGPRHRVYLDDFRIANRLITNGEYLDFIEDGGYRDPLLWLSEGYAWLTHRGIDAPMYWRRDPELGFVEYRLAGETAVEPAAPVTHVSYFEADAYARWAGARLPTEAEWETVALRHRQIDLEGFVDAQRFHPRAAGAEAWGVEGGSSVRQLFGDCWEWTSSAYAPYPGYRPIEGTLGEYNGKFMASQQVLRGGSCATPVDHIRATYRNFFYPKDRWQFTGIRLAKDGAW